MGSSEGEAMAAPSTSQNGGSRSECRQSAGKVSEPHPMFRSSQGRSSSIGSRRQRRERQLESVALIGQGSDALVYLVRCQLTGRMSALKVQQKAEHARTVQRVHMEREVMVDARHPLVAPLYAAFQDRLYLYLEMEYCPGGSLDNFIRFSVKRNLTENEARFYAAEITLGLEFLHSKGYVYRDLKAANVLVAASGHIKLTDFGIAERGKLKIEADDGVLAEGEEEEEEALSPQPLPRVQSSPGLTKEEAAPSSRSPRHSCSGADSRQPSKKTAGPFSTFPGATVGLSSPKHRGQRSQKSAHAGIVPTPPLAAPPCHWQASPTSSACITIGAGPAGFSSSSCPSSCESSMASSSSSAGAGGGWYHSSFFRRKRQLQQQQQEQEPQQVSTPVASGTTPPRPPPPSLSRLGQQMRSRLSRGGPRRSASDSCCPSSPPEAAAAAVEVAATTPSRDGEVPPPLPPAEGCEGGVLLSQDGEQQRERRPTSPRPSTCGEHVATGRATVSLGEASWGLLSGSPEYMAPEVLMHDPQGSAVDWWGLGVLTYELLMGRTPFAGENGKTRLTYLNIMHKEASFPEPGEREEGDISDVCRNFVRALLSKDPRGRAGSASSVRKHPFFGGVRWDSLLLEEAPLRVGPACGRRSSSSSSSPPSSSSRRRRRCRCRRKRRRWKASSPWRTLPGGGGTPRTPSPRLKRRRTRNERRGKRRRRRTRGREGAVAVVVVVVVEEGGQQRGPEQRGRVRRTSGGRLIGSTGATATREI
ncbi:unnamed protein product [Pylaiella littoralis]